MSRPTYSFGFPAGPEFTWFAWRPVRLLYGRWAWLRSVACRRIVKHEYLDGPDWQFWSYSDTKE